jgi:hypothetical protein
MAIVFMMNEEIARGMVCFFHQKKHSYLILFREYEICQIGQHRYDEEHKLQLKYLNIFNYLPPYSLAGFDLETRSSRRRQVKTIPLCRPRRQGTKQIKRVGIISCQSSVRAATCVNICTVVFMKEIGK